MKYSVVKYSEAYFSEWNHFISASKNGTFLLDRNFMEYHSDRFEDYSLMIFEDKTLISVLPAHKINDDIYSHWGLTYGGLIYNEKIKLTTVIKAFGVLLEYLYGNNITKLFVKLIPVIYHKYPSDEFSYTLFVAGASLIRKDTMSIIDNRNKLPFTKTRRQSIRRGDKNGLIIKEESEFELFWNKILIPNLYSRHDVKPVHSAKEIILLQQKFPDNIRHFNVYHGDKIVAGTTVFITDTVAHPQYISGNQDKNELGSLDFLYDHLINEVFKDKNYFDFGISNEAQGRKLNEGLLFWKESFGARTLVHDFYEVETSNFKMLDNVLI